MKPTRKRNLLLLATMSLLVGATVARVYLVSTGRIVPISLWTPSAVAIIDATLFMWAMTVRRRLMHLARARHDKRSPGTPFVMQDPPLDSMTAARTVALAFAASRAGAMLALSATPAPVADLAAGARFDDLRDVHVRAITTGITSLDDATRVRRGSIDHLATDDFVLALGDRVRVTAAQDQLAKVARFFGDQEREAGNINPVATMVGIGLGVALGAIALPLPNGVSLMLGNAGGPLVAGLVLGKLQRTGRFVWTVPFAASSAMSELGLLLFLMYAGSKAGAALFGSLSGTPWVTVLGIGVCVTLTSAILQIALARFVFRTRVFETAGQLAGSQTQPAVLVFVNERLKFNPNVNLAYSFAYPAAMISKVFIAPLLVLFLR